MSTSVTTAEIVKYLREAAQEAKEREAAKQIEKLGRELFGDDTFVFSREAVLIARADKEAFDLFTRQVSAIRESLDEKFKEATDKLGDDNENA